MEKRTLRCLNGATVTVQRQGTAYLFEKATVKTPEGEEVYPSRGAAGEAGTNTAYMGGWIVHRTCLERWDG